MFKYRTSTPAEKGKIRVGQGLSDRKGGRRVVFCNLLEIDITLVAPAAALLQ